MIKYTVKGVENMSRSEIKAELKKVLSNYAEFVSETHIEEMLPATRTEFFPEDITHFKKILENELNNLREYIQLANDMLQDLTLNTLYEIKIVHANL